MWITEVGWATGPKDDGYFTVPESAQQVKLDELYRQLLTVRPGYRLLGAVWFDYRDHDRKPGQAGGRSSTAP